MSQLVNVKMEPDTEQHLELKKDPLLDVEVITRSVIFRQELLYLTHQFIIGKVPHIARVNWLIWRIYIQQSVDSNEKIWYQRKTK